MRAGFIAIAVLGAASLWITYGTRAARDGAEAAAKPSPISTTVPTSFADVRQGGGRRDELDRARRDGRLKEAPKQQALRAAVVSAANRVDAAPCDKQAREALGMAVTEFLTSQSQIDDKPASETAMIDGRVIDARTFLNKEAAEISKAARAAGIVSTSGAMFGQASGGSRFLCSRPG